MARSKNSQPLTSEDFLDIHFSKAGLDVSCPAHKQTKRGSPSAGFIYTTPDAQNVRAFEPGTDRFRGASRAGLSKWIPESVGGIDFWIIQCLAVMVYTDDAAVG